MKELVIDVREPSEFASGHIGEAQLVPLATLVKASAGWDKAQPITLVCKSGRRAEQAMRELKTRGFRSVSVLAGGMDSWREAGKPVVSVESNKP